MYNLITSFSIALFIWQIIILFFTGLWIYCLADVVNNKFINNEKLIWILVVILVPFIGSILYLLIGKKKKLKLD